MPSMYENSLEWLRDKSEELGNPSKAAELLQEPRQNIYKALNRETPTIPRADKFLSWLEKLGARIVFPGEDERTVREIKFLAPTIVGMEAGKGARARLIEDDYLAVPLVSGAVAAGPGPVSEREVHSWVVVFQHDPGIRGRSNLVAMRVAEHQRSMLPVINPGDVLLVDRSDNKPEPDGGIMLVVEPDGAESVKRVSWTRRDGDDELTFCSDNREYPPRTYRLRQHYGAGEWRKALAGRIVWAWSDMTRK